MPLPLHYQHRRGQAPDADPALVAYERCADYYDLLTAEYDHEAWAEAIERVVRAHGGRGHRLLDVACGTGKSALPFARRGYDVWACDLSPAMVRRARMRLPRSVTVFVADMRVLPSGREFDLVTCLDDALNYLLSTADLRATMSSFASVLAPAGIAVFDLNTAGTYRDVFTPECDVRTGGGALRWQGRPAGPSGLFAAAVEPVGPTGAPWRSSLHVQRHHPPDAVRSACRHAGLDVLAIYGQSAGARLDGQFDEFRHTKLLYVVRNGRRAARGGAP
jgi:SAM-dependent methyltransferase